MEKIISKDEFLRLPTEKVRKIIKSKGVPKVGVLIPDGTKKSANFFYDMDPLSENFEEKLFSKINRELMKVIELMFSHGLETLFIPSFTHGNFNRSKKYVDSAVKYGLKYIFNDEKWFQFYDQLDIKVRVYGDLNLIKKRGYEYLIKWVDETQKFTLKNKTHKLFFGLACSNIYEIPRLMDMSIDFFKKEGYNPTLEDKKIMYYGEVIDDIDFFLRPTLLRDSDIQPPLISGNKTQFYFPILPFIFINQNMFRSILYDLIFQRTITLGLDEYNLEIISTKERKWLKNYYKLNKNSIIGIGERIGDLWVPLPQVKLNDKKKW